MDRQEHRSSQGTSRKQLIMLVADDKARASLITSTLRHEPSYRVYQAADWPTAWRFLQHIKPQLLLLDGPDGLPFSEHVRDSRHLRDIPVVMLRTFLPGEEGTQQGSPSLKKNGAFEVLLQTISTLLR